MCGYLRITTIFVKQSAIKQVEKHLAMTKIKWFYPAQEKIEAYLKEKFGECYRCEFQDVCKYTCYENYTAWVGGPINQEHFSIQFVIRKKVTKQSNPSIITVHYGRYEDTLQY